ncbi:MAG: amino acid ABC transporter permease [Hydrogenophaga sp.]|uniref:amino acid ABC transporter permease n=2 Tax=Hydrogenophaga sp. TaxID=1904254 RepID=UPI00272FEE63|nr:amino acid ABC transporter permease [Hydrogenophaga sp.]MDP2408214.1 amino acid ABC transporter permease [Hydrogenophaga sp.]MDZ4173190.1 amino acid ABC transporter permease [Hydrogenophaga sp.]
MLQGTLAMSNAAATPASAPPAWADVSTARHRTSPIRWGLSLLLALVALQVVYFLFSNPRFEWPVVGKYLFSVNVLQGLGTTLVLTVVAMVVGTVIGTVAALALLSDFKPARWAAQTYLWAFRGTPLLIQLIFWYNLAYLIPNIGIGLPFLAPWVEWPTNAVITPFLAALLGLGLAEGAYMTEIVRAGLSSVDTRQHDAARALGMTPAKAFFRIIFPQAMRFIIPPTGNQVIGMAKATALVSVIAMNDLLHSVQIIYNRTYEIVPLLMVAVFWYLVVITLLYAFQSRLERYYSKGHRRDTTQVVPASEQA